MGYVVRLPIQHTDNQDMMLMETKWSSILNPVLENPSLQSNIITGIPIINGTTVINHLLGRKLIGWRVIGINAAANIYDKQAQNQTPQSTLVLVSNAAALINLEVF